MRATKAMQVSRISPTGVKGYKDLADVCREQIRAGTWKTGARIPTVRKLSERFGVTGVTVQRALSTLQQDGYVRTEGRHGSFVTAEWTSRPVAGSDGAASSSQDDRPLRLGMVVGWSESQAHATLPLLVSLERLLMARLFRRGGTFRRVQSTIEGGIPRASVLKQMRQAPVDALVLLDEEVRLDPSLPSLLREAGIVCVQYAGTIARELEGDVVRVDDGWAFRAITQHLLALGHERVACVSLPAAYPLSVEWVHPRIDGWRRAMAHAGFATHADDLLEVDYVLEDASASAQAVRLTAGPSLERLSPQALHGYAAAMRFDPAQHSAAVCINDNVACGMVHGLRQRGLRVPEDVSVTGYDNNPDIDSSHELTTFMVSEEQIADAILSLAERRLNGEKGMGDAMQVTLHPILMARATTAQPARARHPHAH